MRWPVYAITAVVVTVVCAALLHAVVLQPTVHEDPLVRMPGTQPDQGVSLEAPNRCLNCHSGYNQTVEPGYNWMGSMMAQAARDPIFWACLTVAAQDSVAVLGTPNAVDICERCHFPQGWLAGRSAPPNASAMTGSDFDGLHCDVCHTMWNPFFSDTRNGLRDAEEWDEQTQLSLDEEQKTYEEDVLLADSITLFNGQPFFSEGGVPHAPESYTENTSGQYFVSPNSQKRASFADAEARHQMLYSRYHKSKYFCSTCHDVSNPALANLGHDTSLPLPTEGQSAYNYFHVERTWSEFKLSAYGKEGGAATNPEFQEQGAPTIPWADKCQDCHMRDVVGKGANKKGVPLRPTESIEHPASGQPLHDMTGGNAWISYILASVDPNGPVYDPVNAALLEQGPEILTLDLSAGQSPRDNGSALLAGSNRAKQQLQLAATIKDLDYSGGNLTFKVQNNTGHKLISGFPEGRRMFVNIKAKDASGNVIYEVNPYDYSYGTLKGLPHSSYPLTGANEIYVDELVYEVHPSSTITDEEHTFHFVLADGRYKDNRIPPKGFDIQSAGARISEPVWDGDVRTDYFSPEEYGGGYDSINVSDYAPDFPGNAPSVEVTLYYQGTSREYIEFLRDEINGDQNHTLPFENAYIIQTDPFFSSLKAWGDTIWQLWQHNHGLGPDSPANGVVEGIVPIIMTQAAIGSAAPCTAPTPVFASVQPANSQVTLTWQGLVDDPEVKGYGLYYDQAGKAQFITTVTDPSVTAYTDTGLTNGQTYCYKITSLRDCDGDDAADVESGFSEILCSTPVNPGQNLYVTASPLVSGKLETSGKGKNRTTIFVAADSFTPGDTVIMQTILNDDNGAPLAEGVVEITINNSLGDVVDVILSSSSQSDGMAEASWVTEGPNKKGTGGTPIDTYSCTVTNVSVNGYTWDETAASITIHLQ